MFNVPNEITVYLLLKGYCSFIVNCYFVNSMQ